MRAMVCVGRVLLTSSGSAPVRACEPICSVRNRWLSFASAPSGQTIGHTKSYCKVVVVRDDALVGTACMVQIHRWHSRSESCGSQLGYSLDMN
eukprot:5750230-Amphidinium_carterae.1